MGRYVISPEQYFVPRIDHVDQLISTRCVFWTACEDLLSEFIIRYFHRNLNSIRDIEYGRHEVFHFFYRYFRLKNEDHSYRLINYMVNGQSNATANGYNS